MIAMMSTAGAAAEGASPKAAMPFSPVGRRRRRFCFFSFRVFLFFFARTTDRSSREHSGDGVVGRWHRREMASSGDDVAFDGGGCEIFFGGEMMMNVNAAKDGA
jgi:hypothetical protein